MEGSSKAKAKKQNHPHQNQKKGPTGSTEGRKEKSIAELHKVTSLMVEIPNLDELPSPKSSLQALQQQSKEKNQLLEWLTIMKKTQTRMDAIEQRKLQSRSLINDFKIV